MKLETTGMVFPLDHFPIVHPSMLANTELLYYGTDSLDLWKNNCNTMPEDWIYNDKQIKYKFNNVGLRMNKDLNDINEPYVAFFGCSNTLGIGVALEDSFPFLVSKETSLDYMNVGVPGSSIKLSAINFFNLLATKIHIPTCVVFAWPSSNRFTFWHQEEFIFYLPNHMPDDEKYYPFTQIYKHLIMSGNVLSESLLYRNFVMTTCKKLGIGFAELSFDEIDELGEHNVPLIAISDERKSVNLDFARDIRTKEHHTFSHPGIRLHNLAAEKIISQLNT